jgi:uncharacterized protein
VRVSRLLRVLLAVTVLAIIIPLLAVAGPQGEVRTFRPDGSEGCRFDIEVAVSPEEIGRGLMFRDHLPENSGMLFIFSNDETRHFWMKNTLIPLDMVFIDSSLRVVTVHARAKPRDEKVISSKEKARYVLEVNGGKAGRCGIVPGSRVELLPSVR